MTPQPLLSQECPPCPSLGSSGGGGDTGMLRGAVGGGTTSPAAGAQRPGAHGHSTTAGQGASGCGVLPSVLPCLHTHGEGRPMVSPGRGRGPPLALTLAPGARVPQAGGSGSAKSQLLRLRSITADSTTLGISNHAFDPRSLPSLAFNPFPASSRSWAGSAGDGSCSGESRRCSQHPRRGKHPQAQPTSV